MDPRGLQNLDDRTIDAGIDRVRGVNSTQMKKTLNRALRCKTWFALLIVLSPPQRTVLGLVLDVIQYSNPTHGFASYREPPRSTIGIAAIQTAIEHDEIRCEARAIV
jgi:hypothetical protein